MHHDLAAIRADFENARAEAICARSMLAVEPDTCRYCRRWWKQWTGSKLDGHAKCIVPMWFKRQLAELYRSNPALTYEAIGNAIGVTPSVVRSWVMPISNRGPR